MTPTRATTIRGNSGPEAASALIALIRRLGFGTIHNLRVAGGLPVLDPFPRVVQETKFGSEFRPARPRPTLPLRDEDQQLLAVIAAVGDGVIDQIQVRNGLPFRLHRTLENT